MSRLIHRLSLHIKKDEKQVEQKIKDIENNLEEIYKAFNKEIVLLIKRMHESRYFSYGNELNRFEDDLYDLKSMLPKYHQPKIDELIKHINTFRSTFSQTKNSGGYKDHKEMTESVMISVLNGVRKTIYAELEDVHKDLDRQLKELKKNL